MMAQKTNNIRPPKNADPNLADPVYEVFRVFAVCGFLCLAVLLVFGQTKNHEFICCDDDVYVSENPYLAADKPWGEIILWSMTTGHAGNWHPLTWLSHALDNKMYGQRALDNRTEQWAGGHHLTNVVIHALSAILLFLALRLISGDFWPSAIVAAMFAIHPLRAESVAWAAERKDVLSGFFWMLTILVYGWYARQPNLGRYMAVFISFGIGLTAKSMLVTLPCVLFLLDCWPMRRWQPKFLLPIAPPGPNVVPRFAPQTLGWLVFEKLPLFGLTAAVSIAVAIFQHKSGAMSMVNPISFAAKLGNAANSYVGYIWKTIWPVNLAIFYPHPAVLGTETSAPVIIQTIFSAIILAAITVFVFWNLRRRLYLAVGWLWFLGVTVPVLGVILIGAHSMADRYTYLPTIGLYVMGVWGAAELAAQNERNQRALAIFAAVLLFVWTGLAMRQVATWKNSITVFEHSVTAVDDNYFGYNHLGKAYHTKKDMDKAEEYFAKSVEVTPNYDSANGNLGVCLASREKYDEAVPYLEEAARINPYCAGHHSNLGAIYVSLRRFSDAEVSLSKAVELDPDSYLGYLNLVRIYSQTGNVPKLLKALREMLRLSPNDVSLLNQIAWILATSPDKDIRNGTEAVQLSKRAVDLTAGNLPEALDVLAAALAETGSFKYAADAAHAAMNLAVKQNKKPLAETIKSRMLLYQAGIPFHLKASTGLEFPGKK